MNTDEDGGGRLVLPRSPPMRDWPVEPPTNWVVRVNRPQSQKELKAIQTSVRRGPLWR